MNENSFKERHFKSKRDIQILLQGKTTGKTENLLPLMYL